MIKVVIFGDGSSMPSFKIHLMEPITDLVGKTELDVQAKYEARGWDKAGIPTKERLKNLGLEDMV